MASLKARAALANLCLLKLRQLGGRATAREIAADLNKAVEFIQPRLTDLFNEGRIRDTGGRVSSGRGRPQVVWENLETDAAAACKSKMTKVGDLIQSHPQQPAWFSKFGQ